MLILKLSSASLRPDLFFALKIHAGPTSYRFEEEVEVFMKTTVHVSANILNFPRSCCCCALNVPTSTYYARADRTTGKRVVRTVSKAWGFPICKACEEWIAVERKARNWRSLSLILTLSLAYLLFTQQYENCVLNIIFLGLFAYMWKIRREKANSTKPHPSCEVTPVSYLGWRGTVHSFEFSNEKAVEEFQRLNSKKLVG